MKKKLLFVTIALDNGGGERSLINLLQLIDYNEYEVDLLLFKNKGLFLKQIPKNVNIILNENILHLMYSNPLKNIFKLRLSLIHIFGTLISKIKTCSGTQKSQYRWKNYYKKIIPQMKGEYDTAIAYLEGEPILYIIDKVNAKRKIAWIHTDYTKLEADKKFDEEYYRQLDSIVSISDTCVDILKKEFPELSKKFIYLPNLISSEMISFLSNQYYPKEYTDKNKVKLVSIGRLVHIKGFDMALEAAKILKADNYDFKWYIIGEGELKRDLERTKRKLLLNNEIEFLGARTNPYPYIKNADIIVQTSRYEGKSMVLDEAKILEKPIVVTNYDTVRDQIQEGEGKIVEMNPTDIAKGIEEVIKNKKVYSDYLKKNDYGNQKEIVKYYKVFDGDIL